MRYTNSFTTFHLHSLHRSRFQSYNRHFRSFSATSLTYDSPLIIPRQYEIDDTRIRYISRVAYDGTPYFGWQIQPEDRTGKRGGKRRYQTVQGVLLRALQTIFNEKYDPDALLRAESEEEIDEEREREESLINIKEREALKALRANHEDNKGSNDCSNEIKENQKFPPRRGIFPSGASRTDTGVHANGQVIHYDVPIEKAIKCLQIYERSMNSLLPPSIRLYNTTLAPPGNIKQRLINEPFHASKSALKKLYIYRFSTTTYLNPLLRYNYFHYTSPQANKFNEELFLKSLLIFQGTHNFNAFGNFIDKKREELARFHGPELQIHRTIESIKLINEEKEFLEKGGSLQFLHHYRGNYRVEIIIESALHKMIRNIIGTCFHVNLGKLSFNDLENLLYQGKQRCENKAKPAPAHGLCLEHVFYDFY